MTKAKSDVMGTPDLTITSLLALVILLLHKLLLILPG